MKDTLLIVAATVVFVLGYFIVRKVDRFLEDRQNFEEENTLKPSSFYKNVSEDELNAVIEKMPLSALEVDNFSPDDEEKNYKTDN
ncbi:MAG: hypothetical protein J6Z36_00945 [Clostridia bacterium]|nr:hypothetical protein [Clostridia bacterium]